MGYLEKVVSDIKSLKIQGSQSIAEAALRAWVKAPNKKLAYKKIADTNLCYGEGEKYLEKYLSTHRDAIFQPEKPVAGKIIMEVNEMLNLNIATMHKYDWIHFIEPIGHIHSQYLIFEIKPNAVDLLQKSHN